MPSSLRRRLDSGGQRSQEAQQQIAEPQRLFAFAPWGGFCPDLPAALADLRDCEDVYGLVPIRGRLLPPIGAARIGASTLPLGNAVLPSGSPQPVTGVFGYRDPLTNTYRRYALTSDPTIGFMAELISDNWTDIPYAGAGFGITGVDLSTLFDFASFASDNGIIFTNNFDPVYRHTAGGADYTDFSTVPALNPFKAASVTSAFDRIFFLDTTENSVHFPNRLRYTTRGGGASLSGLGSGFFDNPEAGSTGVSVRKLGAVVAAYFRSAVAFFWETGDVNNPLRREYVTTERGLIGRHAVADLGGGEHFGIFTDGWFILREDKSFVELGQREVDGARFPKWHEYFYGRVNTEHFDRIFAEYDSQRRGVWVLWADADGASPNQLWFYDIRTDTVWPQQLPGYPNVLGTFASISDSIGFDEIIGSYPDVTVSYQQLEVREGMPLIAYGAPNGLVFIQSLATYTIDGIAPPYLYRTHRMPLGQPGLMKSPDTLYLSHLQQGSAGPDIQVELFADDGTDAAVIVQQSVSAGNHATDYANGNSSGSTVGVSISGVHPVGLADMQLNVIYPAGGMHKK